MTLISASVLFFALLFTGIGLLPILGIRESSLSLSALLRRFWIGLALSVGFLQIWHLLFPITVKTIVVLSLLSVVGYILEWKGILAYIKSISWKANLPLVGTAAFIWVIVMIQSIDGNLHFDHGLYHMQTVKWLSNFAIVPGLGNLHHRLAFNNASFLYVALMNQGGFAGLALYTSNCLIAFALLIKSLASIKNLIIDKRKSSIHDLFFAVILPFFLWYIANFYFSGYSPDVFISVLQVILAGELIELFETEPDNVKKTVTVITTIVVLSVLMVCIKLSGLVFAISMILTALIVAISRFKQQNLSIRHLSNWAITLLFFGIPWLIRSVIMSGYLVFPSALISFNVPWKIPRSMVEPITEVIRYWSRYGNTLSPDLPFFVWLKQWLLALPRAIIEGMQMIIPLFFVAVFKKNQENLQTSRVNGLMLVFFFSILHILYWFLLAPEIRFIGMSLWIAIAALICLLIQKLAGSNPQKYIPTAALIAIGLTLIWLSPSFSRTIGFKANFIDPYREFELATEFIFKDELVFNTTRSGLVVNLANDYSKESCWDLPLPCTRVNDYYSKLALIDPDDMQKGFYIRLED